MRKTATTGKKKRARRATPEPVAPLDMFELGALPKTLRDSLERHRASLDAEARDAFDTLVYVGADLSSDLYGRWDRQQAALDKIAAALERIAFTTVPSANLLRALLERVKAAPDLEHARLLLDGGLLILGDRGADGAIAPPSAPTDAPAATQPAEG